MKEDVAIKWVEALRSGKYEQGHFILHDQKANTYCCLGVLHGPVLGFPFDKFQCVLDDEGLKAAGMNTAGGSFSDDKPSLWMMNDNMGKSFNEIADVIEANWKDL